MKLFTSLLLFPMMGFAFTITPSTGKGFKSNDITINIANTDCSAAGFSTTELKSMVEEAVDDYWNVVPTSALNLSVGGIISTSIDGDTFASALNKVETNTILAGCNDDVADFDGSSNPGGRSSILGAAQMSCTGDDCVAVLIMNAHSTNLLSSMSRADIVATVAHEIGHAFGLGHSEYEFNLMYYSASNKSQKWLGQDDIDGVTYLYPHDPELAGLMGSCGTLSSHTDDQPGPPGGLLFYIALGGILGLALFRRRNKKATL